MLVTPVPVNKNISDPLCTLDVRVGSVGGCINQQLASSSDERMHLIHKFSERCPVYPREIMRHDRMSVICGLMRLCVNWKGRPCAHCGRSMPITRPYMKNMWKSTSQQHVCLLLGPDREGGGTTPQLRMDSQTSPNTCKWFVGVDHHLRRTFELHIYISTNLAIV